MNLFELQGVISINNKGAIAALKGMAESAGRTVSHIQDSFKKVGSATVKAGQTVGKAALAVKAAWVANIETTRDYRTAMAKLDTAFTTNGHSAELATKTYKALQAVLGETDQAVEAANHLAVMCKNEEELSKWTDICTGVFAQFGDSLPIEGLTEAANETVKTGEVTGTLADALNWCGISQEDMNLKLRACRTEQERQKLLLDTLYPTYKKQAEQYKVNAENILKANEAQDKLTHAMAELGAVGEPILTKIKTKTAEMVSASVPYLETLISKMSNFGKTIEFDVWPWIQKEAKAQFGIELPSWPKLEFQVNQWWTDTKTNLDTVTKWMLQIPDMPHESAEQLAAAVSGWWTSTALPVIENASQWALNLFGHPVEDNATIETHVKEWWQVAGNAVAGACNWTLKLFGMPDETADTITNLASTWWNGVSGFVVDACSYTARFLGFGEWGEEQDAMLDAWWDTVFKAIDDTCQWVLNPKLPNEEETKTFVDSLTAWWTGVQETVRDTFNITPEKEDKYIAYDEALEKAAGESAISQALTQSFTSNPDSFIDFGSIFKALFSNPASVPVEVSEDSESNMQGQVDSMNLEGEVTLYPDTSNLNMYYGGTFSGGRGGGWTAESKAVGLDNVPYDGFYAHLHKGEAILNKVQADQWRGGNSGKVEALLGQVVTLLSQQKNIVLDSGVMVGQLAPAMDTRLGTIGNRKGRGN